MANSAPDPKNNSTKLKNPKISLNDLVTAFYKQKVYRFLQPDLESNLVVNGRKYQLSLNKALDAFRWYVRAYRNGQYRDNQILFKDLLKPGTSEYFMKMVNVPAEKETKEDITKGEEEKKKDKKTAIKKEGAPTGLEAAKKEGPKDQFKDSTNLALKEYEDQTGKQVHFQEKLHPDISGQERLDQIIKKNLPAPPQKPSKSSFLLGPNDKPLGQKPQSPSLLFGPDGQPLSLKPTATVQPKRVAQLKVPYAITNTFKNMLSKTKILARRLISRNKPLVARLLSATTLGAIGALTSGLSGLIIGAAAGFYAPTLLGKLGNTQNNQQDHTPQAPLLNIHPRFSPSPKFSAPRLPKGLGFSGGGRVAGGVVRGGAQLAARALVANPYFWVAVGVILLILLIAFLVINVSIPSEEWSKKYDVTNRVTVKKTGPESVSNGEDITYKLEVTFVGLGKADIDVTDRIDPKTSFVGADSDGKESGGVVTWSIKDLPSAEPKILTLTVKPSQDDVWIVNNADARITSTSMGTGGGCLTPEALTQNKKSPESCQYLYPSINIFDTNISPEALNQYINNYSPIFTKAGKGDLEEFKRRVNFIVTNSQAVGLNPAIFLGYWKTESRFSTVGSRDMGCRGNNFDEQVNCAVGLSSDGKLWTGALSARCASSKINQTEKEEACKALLSIRKSHPSIYGTYTEIKTPITTIDDFAEGYGPRAPNLDGAGKTNNNCVHTYNTLVEVAQELGACTPTPSSVSASGTPTKCDGAPANFGVEKRLLPLPQENNCSKTNFQACGRPGTCVVPQKIVLHTTAGTADQDGTWQYFAGGSGGRGVGSHFIIGKSGETIQAVEMLNERVEVAYAVANYSDHISIEMVHFDKNANPEHTYGGKSAVPPAQYRATLELVKALMKQYKIPLGNLEYEWRSPVDAYNNNATAGVYGHYQLNPKSRNDPGSGLLKDLREDLKAGTVVE